MTWVSGGREIGRAHARSLVGLRRPRASRAAAGMTLVEIMVALVVLTASVYLVSSTIASAATDRITKRQMGIAAEAARTKLEMMRAEAFKELFARYNETPLDDPAGPGTAAGPHFSVEGIPIAAGDADGFAGRIFLPAPGPALYENAANEPLGLPRDLNGDVGIDANDHALDYFVLPVTVRVEWSSPLGKRKVELNTLMSGIAK